MVSTPVRETFDVTSLRHIKCAAILLMQVRAQSPQVRTVCKACPAGTHSPLEGANLPSVCLPCRAGHRCSSECGRSPVLQLVLSSPPPPPPLSPTHPPNPSLLVEALPAPVIRRPHWHIYYGPGRGDRLGGRMPPRPAANSPLSTASPSPPSLPPSLPPFPPSLPPSLTLLHA